MTVHWRGWIASLVGVLCLLYGSPASAAFYLRGQGLQNVVRDEIRYRVEPGEPASIDSIMAASAGWTDEREQPFRGGFGRIRLWARFDLPDRPGVRRILLDAALWDRIDYYIVRHGRVVDHQQVGMLVPLPERRTRISMTPIASHAGFAAVDLEPGTVTTVYALLETSERFEARHRLRFGLWDMEQVLDGERTDRLLEGMYFGIALVLILYNLAMYFLDQRDRSYLYYVALQTVNALFFAVCFGMTGEYLWPGHPEWELYAFLLTPPLTLWTAIQFARTYLDTRINFPKSDLLLKWTLVLPPLLLATLIVPLLLNRLNTANLMLIIFASIPLAVIPIVAVAIAASLSRHPSARLFAIVVTIEGTSSIVAILPTLKILPESDWVYHAVQAGIGVGGILLSMGLVMRMRELRATMIEQQVAEARHHSEHEREKRELIEAQSALLETKVEQRTAELLAAQQKSEGLLANILPRAIIEELNLLGHSEPRRHENASILFTDFAGFTQAVATIPAKRLVQELDEIFRHFDDIIRQHGLEKIKTIGDAYMAACGIPVDQQDHAVRCVRAALALTAYIAERNETAPMKWGLRVGVHSGAVVAGIVGKDKYAYDVWGDTVNLASRLESASDTNRVNVSAYTFELIQSEFDVEYRGKLPAKGKGEIDMYFVLGQRTGEKKAAP